MAQDQEEKLNKLKEAMTKIEAVYEASRKQSPEEDARLLELREKEWTRWLKRKPLAPVIREFEVDGIRYGTPGEDACYVLGCYNSKIKELVIPTQVTYEGTIYNVVAINGTAFFHYNNLEKVILPEGVKEIGVDAFYGCENLTEVNLPDDLITIGRKAFCLCTKLKNIKLPTGIQSIGAYAFLCCESLIDITVPDGIDIIEEGTFKGCSNLTKVVLPVGILKIGEEAFCGCSNLREIDIPDSIVSIGSFAFSDCDVIMPQKLPERFRDAKGLVF